ncbi:hypothetical protein ACIBG7_18670 [Nonomuraea sp. NPDC050328]|uniref:hypothetical protein n=1 Tax=Nonomuraea sp. NPDC050328 TaxID=3364361 RepID=UPI003796A112
MAAKKIRLDLPPGMRGGTIEIDGQPVRGVRGIKVETDINSLTTVTLDVIVRGLDLDSLAHVDVPEKTRETLIALGWTPPTNEQTEPSLPD